MWLFVDAPIPILILLIFITKIHCAMGKINIFMYVMRRHDTIVALYYFCGIIIWSDFNKLCMYCRDERFMGFSNDFQEKNINIIKL